MKIDRLIKQEIYRAQYFSDRAKKINALSPIFEEDKIKNYPYLHKDICIISAIKLILLEPTDWRFCVTKGDITPYIIYFSIFDKDKNERVQICFHSYNKELEKYCKNHLSTLWNRPNNREIIKGLKD